MFGPLGKFRWFDEWNRRRPFDLVKTALPAAIVLAFSRISPMCAAPLPQGDSNRKAALSET